MMKIKFVVFLQILILASFINSDNLLPTNKLSSAFVPGMWGSGNGTNDKYSGTMPCLQGYYKQQTFTSCAVDGDRYIRGWFSNTTGAGYISFADSVTVTNDNSMSFVIRGIATSSTDLIVAGVFPSAYAYIETYWLFVNTICDFIIRAPGTTYYSRAYIPIPTVGQRYTLIFVKVGSALKIYYNGAEVTYSTQTPYTGGALDFGMVNPLVLGTDGDYTAKQKISSYLYYRRALTQTEITGISASDDDFGRPGTNSLDTVITFPVTPYLNLSQYTSPHIIQSVDSVTGLPDSIYGAITARGTSNKTLLYGRAVNVADTSAIQPWQYIGLNTTTGVFAKTINGIHTGGPYYFQVRDSSGDTAMTPSYFYVGDIIMGCGQSNMQGGGATNPSRDAATTDSAFMFKSVWSKCSDPTSYEIGIAASMMPSLSSELSKHFKRPIGIINSGKISTHLISNDGAISWGVFDHVNLENSNNLTNYRLMHMVALSGDSMVVPANKYKFRAMVWYQGEADYDHASDYPAKFDSLKTWVHTYCASNIPIFICQLARDSAATDKEMTDFREMQRLLDDGNTSILAAAAYPLPLYDIHHLTYVGQDTIGKWIGSRMIDFWDGKVTRNSYPQFQSGNRKGRDTAKIVFNSLTSSPPFTGLEVIDSGSTETITDQSVSGTTLYLKTATNLGDTFTVRYMYGANPTVTAPIYGDQGLPIAPFVDTVIVSSGNVDTTSVLLIIGVGVGVGFYVFRRRKK